MDSSIDTITTEAWQKAEDDSYPESSQLLSTVYYEN